MKSTCQLMYRIKARRAENAAKDAWFDPNFPLLDKASSERCVSQMNVACPAFVYRAVAVKRKTAHTGH